MSRSAAVAVGRVAPPDHGSARPWSALRSWRAALLALALAAAASAGAHPANIPVARAKVQPDGKIELTITFDVLAFTLDQTPTTVLDAPMNGLLDGPRTDLQVRLNDAKARFLAGLEMYGGAKAATIDSVAFPSVAEVHRIADSGQDPRLPVMATATVKAHLEPGVRNVAFGFADVLGTVVLSVEFPYKEPVSEPVEPGDTCPEIDIPTQAEIDMLAAAARPRNAVTAKPSTAPDAADARRSIQAQYNAWSKAYMAHDVDTLISILSPDYTLKTAKGDVIRYSEYVVMLKLRKQQHSDTTHYSTEILRMTMRGLVAAIWSRETTTDPGRDGKTGRAKPISYLHDYVDLWIWTGGRWRLRGTVTQKEVVIPTVR